MTTSYPEDTEAYAFSLEVIEPYLSEQRLRELIQEAVEEGLKEIKVDPDLAEADLEGGFAGVGEVAVILLLKKIGIMIGTGFIAGASEKAGEHFFEQFVAPKLRARNLLPKGLRKIKSSGRDSHAGS
jgi:hypothetical protein